MDSTDPRVRIQEAAGKMLMQYGIRSTSMDDIASALGISKKTIYQYFSDKDSLVDSVVNSVLLESERDCRRDQEVSENAVHEILLAMEMMQKMFSTMNPSVLNDLQKYHPTAYQRFRKHKDDYLNDVLTKNLHRGIKEKLYRSDINVNLLARFRVESTMLPFDPNFQQFFKLSLFELQKELLIHFLYGLVTPNGYELLTTYMQTQKKKRTK